MIDLINITKQYHANGRIFTALEHVSLTIGKGEYVSVSGASGAGKSTLLYVTAGLILPDSGTVLFRGESIFTRSQKEKDLYRKREIGFVFQQFHLMPYLTVLDNIRLACYKKDHCENIGFYLEKCSLTEMKDKFPSELSVGEKQRTAFIRAIISEPAILLADEPTGNLDTENSRILMDLISEFHNNGGTVIVVTHNPDIALCAGKTIVLGKGRIISDNSRLSQTVSGIS